MGSPDREVFISKHQHLVHVPLILVLVNFMEMPPM
jgi:hypothetical protein